MFVFTWPHSVVLKSTLYSFVKYIVFVIFLKIIYPKRTITADLPKNDNKTTLRKGDIINTIINITANPV